MFDMAFSTKIVTIIFLFTYLGSIKSADEELTKNCINDVYSDFGFGQGGADRPHNVRLDLPIRSFLKMVEKDFQTKVGKGYYKHIHDVMEPNKNMKLPIEYCDSQTKELPESIKKKEKSTCISLLLINFLNINDRTRVLRDSYWNFKETHFSKVGYDGTSRESDLTVIGNDGKTSFYESTFTNYDGSINYKYMYFYHLSQSYTFDRSERDLPFTPKSYCKSRKRAEENENQQSLSSMSDRGSGSNPSKSFLRVYNLQDIL